MYGTEKMEVKKITELKKAQTEHFLKIFIEKMIYKVYYIYEKSVP